MQSARLILALVSGVGLLAMGTPNAVCQSAAYDASALSAPESAAYQLGGEARPVQAVLRRFDYALEMHDVGLLQAAGVNRATAKLWQRFFSENPHATVTDRCPVSDLYVSDNTASWTCIETATIISEGKPKSFDHVIRFMFAKNGAGVWMVADRR
jgi:hypothetical protein